ncbi:MAG: hypothetical protein KU29_07860 [Sulfurovum sp. FS06-10]|nr:MAG: hypothetical protein KU29_07860 [Sulfurovum sp. FS06-10]
MTTNQIIIFLKQNKQKFLDKYQISKMTLFGSYARGENREDSDVDILYTLKEGSKLTFDKYMEFENELKKAFHTRIDLINEKKLNPLVKIEAQKDFIYV